MPDAMTPELCREHQRECAEAVRRELHELRQQTASDIGTIRTAVQDIDRAVAQIKGYLRINGSGPHPHKRDNEDELHVHKREEDTLGGWVLKNLGWLITTGLLLAAFAGDRIVQHLAK